MAGVIGKLSEGAVFLLFRPRPPDRFPFCCPPPTPEPRGTFTALGTPGGNKGRGARGGRGQCRGLLWGTGGRWGVAPPAIKAGAVYPTPWVMGGPFRLGGVEPGMYHVTGGKAEAGDLSGGQAEYKFGAPFYLTCACMLSRFSHV